MRGGGGRHNSRSRHQRTSRLDSLCRRRIPLGVRAASGRIGVAAPTRGLDRGRGAPRGNRRGRLGDLVTRWGILALCLYLAVALLGQQVQLAGLERRRAELLAERDHVVAANLTLRQHVARLRSDEYLEQAAREELGMVRPGEILYTIGQGAQDQGR